MIIRVLGSAAGGGVPQWNCACSNCESARVGRTPRRTESSVAVSTDGSRWLLLNCSTDVAEQIEAYSALHPRSLRITPIEGILLTDANLDHLGGLAILRQAGDGSQLRVRSSTIVRSIGLAQPPFAHFGTAPHRWVDLPLNELCGSDGEDDLVGNQLSIRVLPVAGRTPGYDGRRGIEGAVVAYEIAERGSDRRLLFAPVFGAIDDALADAIAAAKIAFLDGTFFSDDELRAVKPQVRGASELGHQPIGGPDGSLARLRGLDTRLIFTHINNSNPVLDPYSAAYEKLREHGAELAYDGMELAL